MTRTGHALHALCGALRANEGPKDDLLERLDDDGWLDVLALANAHRLGPALRESLVANDGTRSIPDDVHAYLDQLYEGNRRRNTVVRRQAIEVVAALNRSGIRPLLLKGVLSLVADRWRNPATRIMADIDLAVPPACRRTAERTLRALRYRVGDRYPDGHHAVAEFRRAGDPAAVDLHIELIDQDYLLPAAKVFARASTVETDGVSFLVPTVGDRLMHALLHAQLHHMGQFYLGRIALAQLHEFCMLANAAGLSATNWREIDEHLDESGLAIVLDAYLVAAGRLFGLRWPLARPPHRGAGRQFRRWQTQLHMPFLSTVVVPVGNLIAAFAEHRMCALYGDYGSPLSRRLRHAHQYLRRHNSRDLAARVLRGIDA